MKNNKKHYNRYINLGEGYSIIKSLDKGLEIIKPNNLEAFVPWFYVDVDKDNKNLKSKIYDLVKNLNSASETEKTKANAKNELREIIKHIL